MSECEPSTACRGGCCTNPSRRRSPKIAGTRPYVARQGATRLGEGGLDTRNMGPILPPLRGQRFFALLCNSLRAKR
jgi:hypothetical protein